MDDRMIRVTHTVTRRKTICANLAYCEAAHKQETGSVLAGTANRIRIETISDSPAVFTGGPQA